MRCSIDSAPPSAALRAPATPGLAIAMAVLLSACAGPTEPEGEDCELLVMAPCPECGPGEVTGGVGFSLRASFARQASGDTVVLACGRATFLDASYNVKREVDLDVPRYSKIVADLASEELFILEADADAEYPEFPPTIAIRSVAPNGSTRWRVELDAGDFPDFVAIPGGVALTDINRNVARVFDRDGNELAIPAVVGVADPAGGMIGVTTTSGGDTGPSTATLTSVDASGQVRWTRTWTAPAPGFPGWLEVKPYPLESGDVVVAGGFTGEMFDVGGTTLTGVKSQTAFVARLDPMGATRWAYTLPYQAWNVSAVAHGDGVLAVGGAFVSDDYALEVRLIPVTAVGPGTELLLGSMSDELGTNVEGMYAHGTQATAVIDIYSAGGDYEQDLTLGWHRLLSGLHGRTYLVELNR